MELICTLEGDRQIQAWTKEKNLFLQYKEGEHVGKAYLFAQDCDGELSGVQTQDTVYLVYRTTQGDWVLRNCKDAGTVFNCSGRFVCPFVREDRLYLLRVGEGEGDCPGNVTYIAMPDGREEVLKPLSEDPARETEVRESAELDRMREQLRQKQEEIETLRKMIGSAKTQYSDLMQVAQQYRDEAVKWRSKFMI